jgi:hypothetical protein
MSEDKKKYIAKLFRNINLEISFKTENTIGKLLTENKNTNINILNKSGVYQSTYQYCDTANISK